MQIRFLAAFVLLFFFYASHAQEGEILVDGVALDLREPMTSCFQFAPFKAKLTGEGEKYLDTFAHFYEGQTAKSNQTIVFDLGVSQEERQQHPDLVMRRAKAVRRYLWRKNKINLLAFRVRIIEKMTTTCYAYIGAEPRGERRKLK
ncbi:hypothetical protein [Chryseolinea lacunae]|uniref:OmpA-like domain-containing protein n=1 Tax=Chryseolinea lacunae TaxID=2801331 RepID=A0ABS1L189_9BACT|nr:hypothetical protein [Chryseolinea lacunae]MBL0745414.1 hypothetical protein [Chryseolinea lacunae]